MTDAALKEDPRPHVSLLLPDTASTGEIIPVGEIPRHKLQVAILLVAEQDTERQRHDRRRVRPELADSLAPELRQIAEGRQTGVSESHSVE